MLRVALTGGIGTGKTYCLERFAMLGVPVISADELARGAVAPGTPALDAIRRRFGPAVFMGDALDRRALARIVFEDAAARRDLEAIVHPVVYDAIASWFGGLDPATVPVAIADIPLLFETGRQKDFDCVVVAACPVERQIERVMQRDGLTQDEATDRLAAQMPIEYKRASADFVIDTAGTLADTDAGVARVWAALRTQAGTGVRDR